MRERERDEVLVTGWGSWGKLGEEGCVLWGGSQLFLGAKWPRERCEKPIEVPVPFWPIFSIEPFGFGAPCLRPGGKFNFSLPEMALFDTIAGIFKLLGGFSDFLDFPKVVIQE